MLMKKYPFMPMGPGIYRVFLQARLESFRSNYWAQQSPNFKKTVRALMDEIKLIESHPDYRQAEPYGA